MLLNGELPWCAGLGMPAWPSCLSANGFEDCPTLLPILIAFMSAIVVQCCASSLWQSLMCF